MTEEIKAIASDAATVIRSLMRDARITGHLAPRADGSYASAGRVLEQLDALPRTDAPEAIGKAVEAVGRDMIEWIDKCWPEGSGSDFNQGVVRGFNIIRAALDNGYLQKWLIEEGPALRALKEHG